jgi:hypothetical protein
MNVYELVFAIVLVITVGQIIRSRQGGGHSRRRGGGGSSAAQEPPGARSDARIEALEERIAVLERIVTDQGYELRQKFRDLE